MEKRIGQISGFINSLLYANLIWDSTTQYLWTHISGANSLQQNFPLVDVVQIVDVLQAFLPSFLKLYL